MTFGRIRRTTARAKRRRGGGSRRTSRDLTAAPRNPMEAQGLGRYRLVARRVNRSPHHSTAYTSAHREPSGLSMRWTKRNGGSWNFARLSAVIFGGAVFVPDWIPDSTMM